MNKGMRLSEIKHRFGESLRFVIVGVIATLIQYGVYYALLDLTEASNALTVGYVVSLVCNYILTTKFTFNVKRSKRNATGFVVCHVINWILQLVTLNIFIFVRVPEVLAPIPMYMVCLPVNFLMVRFVMRKL